MITKASKAAYDVVNATEDVIGECERRFGGFPFTVAVVKIDDGSEVCQVEARWTSDGGARGLRQHLPKRATEAEIQEAKRSIARQALYNDEVRKATS